MTAHDRTKGRVDMPAIARSARLLSHHPAVHQTAVAEGEGGSVGRLMHVLYETMVQRCLSLRPLELLFMTSKAKK